MKNKKLLIGIGVVIAAIAIFVVVSKKKKDEQVADTDVQKMIDASNKAGADTFQGMTLAQVKAKLAAGVTKADIMRATELFAIPAANDGNTPEGKEFMGVFSKITGKIAQS